MVSRQYTAQESLNDIRLRMIYDSSKTLTENKVIKESMELVSRMSESVVITDWASPDDRYLILFDDLYDLKTSQKLGNVWENFDNFKLFISHSFEVATNVPKQIKESILESIKSLVLTESTSDMARLKPMLKEFLTEEGFVDWVGSGLKKTGEWALDSVKKFGSDIADIATSGWEGIKKAGIAISNGDWKQILNLLGSGMLFLARKLRSLLYNPVGIVLDAILIATEIGKAVQWVPWAIVVALDLYELMSGNFEEKDMPTWMRWIMIGTDILGLVFAGGVAKAAKASLSVFRGVKTEAQFAEIALKNPNTVKFIEKIAGSISLVPKYLGKAVSYLKNTKLAKASSWIQNILGKSESLLAKGTESLSKISSAAKNGRATTNLSKTATDITKNTLGQTVKSGAKAGLKTGATVAGIDKGFKKGYQLFQGKTDAEMQASEFAAKSLENYQKQTGMSFGDAFNAAQ